MLDSPLPCVAPRSWLEYPNLSFNTTSAWRELVLANLAIDDSPTTRVQPADHRAWGMYSEHD